MGKHDTEWDQVPAVAPFLNLDLRLKKARFLRLVLGACHCMDKYQSGDATACPHGAACLANRAHLAHALACRGAADRCCVAKRCRHAQAAVQCFRAHGANEAAREACARCVEGSSVGVARIEAELTAVRARAAASARAAARAEARKAAQR